MAETAAKSTPPGISLQAAHDLTTKLLLGASSFAALQLLLWLKEGRLHWGYMRAIGRPRPGRTLQQEANGIWEAAPLRLEVNWTENFVSRPMLYDATGRRVIGRVTVIGVYISSEDIVEAVKRLPTAVTQQALGRKPPPVSLTKEAALLSPTQWLVHAVDRFPLKEGETHKEYAKRLERAMGKELKKRAWKAGYIERRLYELKLLPPRQPRAQKL
jgi:hypothetical protein